MFVSQFSGKQYGAGVTPVKIVIEKRPKDYTVKDRYKVDHIVGQGWEIVREIICGPDEVDAVQAKWPCPNPTLSGFQRVQFKTAWSDDKKERRGRDEGGWG